MIVELEEMKGYLRVDFDDDDELIKYFIVTGENLCADIARISVEELSEIPSCPLYFRWNLRRTFGRKSSKKTF